MTGSCCVFRSRVASLAILTQPFDRQRGGPGEIGRAAAGTVAGIVIFAEAGAGDEFERVAAEFLGEVVESVSFQPIP